MKIAIVGAGFFGHHIAAELAVRYPSATVDIFEMAHAPLLGAGTINQCRLHLGFHYPRSGYTIYQSVINYDRFLDTYGEFLNPVDNNLYAVHRDGLSTAEQYLAVMDSFSLPYERMEVPRDLFLRPEEITLLLRVPERSIDVRLVRSVLSERFSGTLNLGITIDEIDPTAGRLFSGTSQYGPFDFVINATYVDPNLGLPEGKRFRLKHELTALVLAKTSLPATTAVTIMDGSFVSLYPAYGGLHTLSSVTHTPFRKYPDVAELLADYPRRDALAVQERVSERIGEHVQEHLGLTYSVKEVWVTAKTKLATDKGDSRVTEVRRHDRLFSVLCGKIDAVFGASDTILKEMN